MRNEAAARPVAHEDNDRPASGRRMKAAAAKAPEAELAHAMSDALEHILAHELAGELRIA